MVNLCAINYFAMQIKNLQYIANLTILDLEFAFKSHSILRANFSPRRNVRASERWGGGGEGGGGRQASRQTDR